jgi:uncharacterized protein
MATRLSPQDLVDESVRVLISGREILLAEKLRLATNPWTRLRGLLGTAQLEWDEGLLIRPCASVHTFFMRYPIDLVFLAKDGEVVGLRESVVPWRITPYFPALCTLELAAGRIKATALELGERVVFEALE